MSDDVIQGLWIGTTLPTMQRMSISSFLAQGHDYHLYSYDGPSGVPKGTRLKDASEIIPASAVYRDARHNSFAPFADRFRYKLLLERGGWWADTDVICLRHFSFPSDHVFSAEHRIAHGVVREVPTTTVMRGPCGSRFLEDLYNSSLCYESSSDLGWNELGSMLVGKLIARHGLDASVQRAITFCPIPMATFSSVLDPNIQFVFEVATYAAHLWHELWRRDQIEVDGVHESDCLYEQFKRFFLDAPPPVVSPRHFKVESKEACAGCGSGHDSAITAVPAQEP